VPAGLGSLAPVQTGRLILSARHVQASREKSWYPPPMTIKARVHSARFVVAEPTELPDGTEVDLLPLDPGDWLDPEDRAAFHRALLASQEDLEAGPSCRR
jgi:hypothetical protein